MEDEDSRTVWVGNFNPDDVTQETLYELFLQAGPLYYVKIPKDKTSGKNKSFAFVCFRHSVSVAYAIELLNGIAVYGRNLRVQSRNLQHLQQKGLASGPAGIHSLDPDFGKNKISPRLPQPCGQQSLLQTPSLLGMPGNNMMPLPRNNMVSMPGSNMMAMAQQQMALLSAYQPIPLSANPLLNAPRERHSDRHGSVNYSRGSPYQRGSYSNDHRGDHSNSRESTYSSYGSNRNPKDKTLLMGDRQRSQSSFDYSRLGSAPGREQHSPYNNDHYKRQNDKYDRHRSGSQHSRYDSSRRDDSYYDRHHTDSRSGRSYRH